MSPSITLIDKYKKVAGIASDNACANALGVTRATVSRWRNGQGHPEPDTVEAMCKATGDSLAHWLPLIEAERARNPEARKVWLRLAQMAAAVALTVGLASPTSPAHAQAQESARNSGTLYIM